MEKVETIIEMEHFIRCPHCGKSKEAVDQLFSDDQEKPFGEWFCYECGGAYKGVVKGMDVFVEKSDRRKDDCLIFMKNANVLLIIGSFYYDGKFDIDSLKNYYEDTCPINYLGGEVEMVINTSNGDRDPHGIFKFIGAVKCKDIDASKGINVILPKDAMETEPMDFKSLPIESIMRQRKKHLNGEVTGKKIKINRSKDDINKQLDAESQFLNWIKVFYR